MCSSDLERKGSRKGERGREVERKGSRKGERGREVERKEWSRAAVQYVSCNMRVEPVLSMGSDRGISLCYLCK